jgi:D-threonate/D-erythronate kinase
MRMKSLLILADDLTGAADCAARCSGAGMPATIALRPPRHPPPAGALALTSDTRHLCAEAAARRVYELVASTRSLAGVTWYKKIDSTLRGNIGAELDAMLVALGRDCALICPAFPAQRRGLRDGYLVSPMPAAPAHLPTLLGQQTPRPVATIALEDVRAGGERLAKRLADARREAQLLVADAMAEQDLEAILDAAARSLPDALLCGSAGMVGALVARQLHAGPANTTRADAALPGGARALLVVGSGSTMARRQIAYLCQHQQVELIEVAPALGEPDGRPPTTDHRLPTTIDDIVLGSRFSVLRDMLLHLPEPPPDAGLEGPAARACAARLAEVAQPLIARLRPAPLILAGGDTASLVLGRLGVEQLTVLRELLPGIALARGADAAGQQILVILKAGNHGD